MTRSSLANAFIVLARKPFVLLLLFPFEAFFPLCLLLQPSFTVTFDDTLTFPRLMLILGVFTVILLLRLLKAVVLLPPAAELLSDGAAGRATPPGWFLRGLQLHWWKRLPLALIEWASWVVLYVFFQVVIMFVMSFAMLALVPVFAMSQGLGANGPSAAVLLLLFAVILIGCGAITLAQFAVETLGAYLYPALVGKRFGEAFKAVFSRRGMRLLPKFAGGRLLVAFVRWAFVFAVAVVHSMLTAGLGITDMSGFGQTALFAALMGLCLFVSSYLSVYRHAFEFCVFREADGGGGQAKPPDEPAQIPLTKNGE